MRFEHQSLETRPFWKGMSLRYIDTRRNPKGRVTTDIVMNANPVLIRRYFFINWGHNNEDEYYKIGLFDSQQSLRYRMKIFSVLKFTSSDINQESSSLTSLKFVKFV